MIGTKEIKRRIRGVTNIQQITRAMEMVAASRLKKAQSRALSSRPYSDAIKTLMEDLLSWSSEGGVRNSAIGNRKSEIGNIALVFITSDRGLCGGFNANVIRKAHLFIRENYPRVKTLIPIGKKGYDFMRRRGYSILAFYNQSSKEIPRALVGDIVRTLMKGYGDAFTELHLLYTRFESVTRSLPLFLKLLPLESGNRKERSGARKAEPLLEPSLEEMIQSLLPRYIEAEIYGAMAESLASEQGARMVAMRSATDNAEEMIKNLTLFYNQFYKRVSHL